MHVYNNAIWGEGRTEAVLSMLLYTIRCMQYTVYYIEGLQTKQAQPGLQTCQEIILTFYPHILSTPAEVIQKR